MRAGRWFALLPELKLAGAPHGRERSDCGDVHADLGIRGERRQDGWQFGGGSAGKVARRRRSGRKGEQLLHRRARTSLLEEILATPAGIGAATRPTQSLGARLNCPLTLASLSAQA